MDGLSLKLFKHIGLSALYKSGSIIIGILLVPLSISYLGNENYGLWLTIFSFIGWFNFVDFGIGNGLRNKLSQALATNNLNLAKKYVSTTYVSICLISIFTALIFVLVFPFVNWAYIFNYAPELESINILIYIAFLLFSINLTLKIIGPIFYADQKSSIPEFLSFVSQLIGLTAVIILMNLEHGSILAYGVVIMSSQMIVILVSTLISFFGSYKNIRPSIKDFEWKYVKDIISIGGKFFVLQISATAILSTDNFIINKILGSSNVTSYSIAHKYFMLVMTAMTLISSPYWSAFTKAYAQGDFQWLKKSMKMLNKISLVIIIVTFCMIVVANSVYNLWVGTDIKIPILLTLFMGLNTAQKVYLYPKVMFLNGTGKIQIELVLSLFLSLSNIPLSIYLARNLEMGVAGVILSTLLVGLIELIIYPIQVKKILNQSAHGIWNK